MAGRPCTTAVRDNANVWSQLTVGTTTIAGRSRLGAVPYAVEAQRASGLTPAGLAQVAPVRTFYAAGAFTRASGEGVWVPINQLRVSFTATVAGTAEIFSLLNVYGETGATRCCIRYLLDGVELGGGGTVPGGVEAR